MLPITSQQEFLAHDHLLPVKHLHSLVRLPVHHFKSQFGLRHLSEAELGSIFGLPQAYWPMLTVHHYPILPIQALDIILRQFLPQGTNPCKLLQPMTIPAPVSDDLFVSFPGLSSQLPPDWHVLAAVQSQKATKADDAAVPIQLWNNRILSLFPHAAQLLSPLRQFVLRYLQRKLYLEFRNFLRKVYPSEFARYLRYRSHLYYVRFRDRRLGGGSFF